MSWVFDGIGVGTVASFCSALELSAPSLLSVDHLQLQSNETWIIRLCGNVWKQSGAEERCRSPFRFSIGSFEQTSGG